MERGSHKRSTSVPNTAKVLPVAECQWLLIFSCFLMM